MRVPVRRAVTTVRAVVIVYMISSDPAEAAKVRKDIAERMAKKAPD
jgi:hypothetical protein